jgi:Transglutaminase-like enzymes, putative cysteine proteases
MKIAVRYEAVFQYEEPAGFSPHVVRIFPRRDLKVQVDRADFRTHAGADVQHRQDLFDNLVASCFYPEPLRRLDFHLALDLTIAPRNPFHFLLDTHALEMPFRYRPREAEVLAPYLKPRETGMVWPDALRPASRPRPTVETLVSLNLWLHKNIAYERREEGDPLPPAETLRGGKGSCRDFAVLFAEALRAYGVAARLVSGFLWEDAVPEEDRRAVNALHAWVEGYLPGAGWVGMDPTNGVFCDHHFLPTAIGLTPADIAPITGHYYGQKPIASTLKTTLSIGEISP